MEKSPLLADAECLSLETILYGESQITLKVKTHLDEVACPSCDIKASRIHSRYERTLQDLPWQGVRVVLKVNSRRFFCDNPDCTQTIFCERLAKAAGKYARKTRRLGAALKDIGFAASCEAAAVLSSKLGMPVSPDVLLKRLRSSEEVQKPTPRVLGVDDWALKKGMNYGTVLVDLEKREVVDLIEDRSAEALNSWLQDRPGVEIISRDRSTEYKKGASEGAPDALQIADRWHLLNNVKQLLERYIKTVLSQLKKLPIDTTKADEIEALFPNRPALSRQTRAQKHSSQATRAVRLENYKKVKHLFDAGMGLLPISRKLGLSRVTVRTYAYADAFPERARPPRVASMLDPYLDYIDDRLTEGCTNASLIWRELKEKGFTGNKWQVLRYVQHQRKQPSKHHPFGQNTKPAPKVQKQLSLPLPSAKQLSWLLLKSTDKHSRKESLLFEHVLQHQPLKAVREQAIAFRDIVTKQDAAAFPAWLSHNELSTVPALKTFTEGIRSDYDAVYAALTYPWSNGQVEGQVTRIKYLKRMMYGRANFDLLRARVLHAA